MKSADGTCTCWMLGCNTVTVHDARVCMTSSRNTTTCGIFLQKIYIPYACSCQHAPHNCFRAHSMSSIRYRLHLWPCSPSSHTVPPHSLGSDLTFTHSFCHCLKTWCAHVYWTSSPGLWRSSCVCRSLGGLLLEHRVEVRE